MDGEGGGAGDEDRGGQAGQGALGEEGPGKRERDVSEGCWLGQEALREEGPGRGGQAEGCGSGVLGWSRCRLSMVATWSMLTMHHCTIIGHT